MFKCKNWGTVSTRQIISSLEIGHMFNQREKSWAKKKFYGELTNFLDKWVVWSIRKSTEEVAIKINQYNKLKYYFEKWSEKFGGSNSFAKKWK